MHRGLCNLVDSEEHKVLRPTSTAIIVDWSEISFVVRPILITGVNGVDVCIAS